MLQVHDAFVRYHTSGQALVDVLTATITPRRPWRERFIERLIQLLCRHTSRALRFEGRRVMLRCTSCHHDTPGWEVSGCAPRPRFAGDPTRHKLR